MKKILFYILILASVGAWTSCKKMDGNYKDFVVTGGKDYPQKANNARAFSGKNRVKISWLRGANPKINKARIFWNFFADSLEITIPPSGDTINVFIENLPERKYSFVVKTYDEKGNISVPVEVLGAVYGDRYQTGLLNRPVMAAYMTNLGNVKLQWGAADKETGAFATEIKYTENSGMVKNKRFAVTETISEILDIKAGTNVAYRTLYLPDSISIDTFYTPYQDHERFALDKAEWRIIDFSTEHDDGANGVKNMIDGTDGTRWHGNVWGAGYPHWLTIDMGIERTITEFGVWRTTFENGGDERGPDKIRFEVSTDNVTWADLGTYDFKRFINGEQSYKLPPPHQKARYFKLVAVSGPHNYTVLGEVSAYGN